MEEDIRLIGLVLKGSKPAFNRLVVKYQDFVFSIALKVLKDREEAEEAAQDVFLKVYKTLGSFEKKSKFSTWLYTITYRTALDRTRKKSLHTLSTDDDDSYLQIAGAATGSPDEQLMQQDLSTQLQLAVDQLQPADASLITLFYLQENSVKEVAEITGLTVTNVKTKLHRLREKLKTILAEQLKGEYLE